jgi:hypothetical protein
MLAEAGERVSDVTYSNGNGSAGDFGAKPHDSIDGEVQPDAALSRGIATALRSSLAQTDAGSSATFDFVTGGCASDRPMPVNAQSQSHTHILANAIATALQGDSEPLCPKSAPVEHTTDRVPSDLEDRIAFALRADTRS